LKQGPRHILLLGLGEHATAFYQQYLICLADGAEHELTLKTLDFAELNAFLPDKYQQLCPRLEKELAQLDWKSFDALLIPNITLHAAIDRLNLPAEYSKKLIHPVSATLDLLQQKKIDRITLAATRHTMQSHQLSTYFSHKGIEVKRPETDDMQRIDDIRLEVFEAGFSENAERELTAILRKYQNPLLACTELSLLNRGETFLDMGRCQLHRAFDLAGQ